MKKKQPLSFKDFLEFSEKFEITLGKILSVEEVPKSKKLWMLRVHFGADPKMGDDYIMSVVASEGKLNEEVKRKYQGAVISDDYSDMLIKLGENKQYYFITDELKDSWLKDTCEKTKVKEALLYHLSSNRTRLIYGSVTSEEVGNIEKNKDEIQAIIKKITKIYKNQ